MKTCTHCGVTKTYECFSSAYAWGDGYRPDCRQCISDRGKSRRLELGTTEMTARKHGTDAEMYTEILSIQGDVCAICKKPREEGTRALSIDHNHSGPATGGVYTLAPDVMEG